MEFDDNDLCGIEALEILRPASDYLLQLVTSGQIDLNRLARLELRARGRDLGGKWVGALAWRMQP